MSHASGAALPPAPLRRGVGEAAGGGGTALSVTGGAALGGSAAFSCCFACFSTSSLAIPRARGSVGAGAPPFDACEPRGGGAGWPRTATAPAELCSPSITRTARSGSPATLRNASARLSRKWSSLRLSTSRGRSFWRKITARRAVRTDPPSYLSSIWVRASAPALRLTRTPLNAPLALLRSMLARPALASISRVASVIQRSPPLCAEAPVPREGDRPARQYATHRPRTTPAGRAYLRGKDQSIDRCTHCIATIPATATHIGCIAASASLCPAIVSGA